MKTQITILFLTLILSTNTQRIINTTRITRWDACLGTFDSLDGTVKSFFASIFEDLCDSLDTCYKNCLTPLDRDECEEAFKDTLEDQCESEYSSSIGQSLCKRKAGKWEEYANENNEEYYEENKCKPVALSSLVDGDCINNTVGEDTDCVSDAALWRAHQKNGAGSNYLF